MNPSALFNSLTGLHPNSASRRAANAIALALSQQSNVVIDRVLLSDVDRAWRKVKGGDPLLAPHYARALYGRLQQDQVPLQLTHVLAHQSEDVVGHCIHVSNLILNAKYDWASKYTVELLTAFATDSDALFPTFLDSFATLLSMAGWAGYAAGGQIEASDPECAAAFRRKLASGDIANGQREQIFGVESVWPAPPQGFDEGAILCPGAALPKAAQCDGRARWAGDKLVGWFSYRRAPLLRPKIVLTDETGNVLAFAAGLRRSHARWGFSTRVLDNSPRGSAGIGDWLHVRASLSGIGQLTLPASPLPTRNSRVYSRPAKAISSGLAAGEVTATATVIVPVFNNLTDSLRCLNTLATTLPTGWDVIVVDDGSTETGAEERLATTCQMHGFDYCRTPLNQGYSHAVNRGMASSRKDVVLLNSDTVIFNGVLADLSAVAEANVNAATVTAPSTDHSVAGIGLAGKDEASAIRLAAAINDNLQLASKASAIAVPTGVGHCLYIKRAALDQVGLFDAAAFPGGYGEETDFCFRAGSLGWKHLISAGSFIYHAGGKSFASRRLALMERAEKVMIARYPSYLPRVRACLVDPALQGFKRSINEYLLRSSKSPIALLIGPQLGGGVDRAISNQIAQLAECGTVSVLLHPAATKESGAVNLQCSAFPGMTLSYRHDEIDRLEELVAWMGVASVHIHHFVGIPRRLLDYLADQYGNRSTIYAHDYSWACPRLNLLGPNRTFCKVPPIRTCEHCIARQGSLLPEDISVSNLRHASATLFNKVAWAKAVSTDIRSRLSRMLDLDAGRFEIQHLEKDLVVRTPDLKKREQKNTIRVAIMGAIGVHKGYDVILDCLSDAKQRSLSIEYSLLGFSSDDQTLGAFANFSVSGPYQEYEAEYLLLGDKADIFFCSSIVPETWCYTLSYALKIGLPIVSFDIGAQSERLRDVSHAHLVPLGTPAGKMNDLFVDISRTDFSRRA